MVNKQRKYDFIPNRYIKICLLPLVILHCWQFCNFINTHQLFVSVFIFQLLQHSFCFVFSSFYPSKMFPLSLRNQNNNHVNKDFISNVLTLKGGVYYNEKMDNPGVSLKLYRVLYRYTKYLLSILI